ncbi:DEAD/DEAH box helicase, partial [Sphingomonas bacterium]|uniref:DEAD/DEAH box helicase n=1 Tax=Sphingomonas bacterium TaxID=1895847 RepID=UPI001576212D
MSFSDLGLAEPLVRALEAKGYAEPTPIQRDAIPLILEGRDLLGIAQTGTGKTAAFVLPSIQRLAAADKRVLPTHCRMLVLAPTRELASQIADNARGYGKFSKLSVATVFGGTSINKNRQDLSRGVDILVATPGRLIDLIEQGFLTLAMVEILVLDEADQMLDLGFIHALKRIVKMLPRKRHTLFFSATMPTSIRELADQYLHEPATVSVVPAATTAERVDQTVTLVNQAEKQALLTLVLRDPAVERALVFTRTKHGADRVVKLLAGNGIASNAIHGNKSQGQRERALAEFKSGSVKVLIATDIAARGIDVSGVSHVVNFELPNVPEQYVHRIGRTARAGASGIAIAFCAEDERTYLRDIERLTRQKIPQVALPADFRNQAEALKAARVKAIGNDPAPREERPRHKMLSRGGSLYSRLALGLDLHDVTGGYR